MPLDMDDLLGEHTYCDTYTAALKILLNNSPGRFFAVTELKTMVAHIVTNYDIKLEKDHEYPQKVFLEQQSFPNMQAKIMFRKRSS